MTRNPDYYCRVCGRDSESGGEPAVCDDCRTSGDDVEPLHPTEFANTVAELTGVNAVDGWEVRRSYSSELQRVENGDRPAEPRMFVEILRREAGLDAEPFAKTLIASIYQYNLRQVARPSAADDV